MKTVTTALETVLAATGNTLTRCWQIITRRGEFLGFTKHTRDLTIDGVVYQSLWGVREAAIESHEGFAVDNQDLTIFLSKVDTDAIDAGRYDMAQITVFDVDAQQPDAGRLPHKVGVLGNITRRDGTATVEIRGPTQFLQTKLGQVYTVTCPVRLGSPRCGVRLQDEGVLEVWVIDVSDDSLTVDGHLMEEAGFHANQVIEIQGSTTNDGVYVIASVSEYTLSLTGSLPGSTETTICTVVRRNGYIYATTVASVNPAAPRRIFTVDTLLDAEGNPPGAGWFHHGNVQFTTGANVGVLAKDIRTHTLVEFTLFDEFPFDIEVGDELVLEAGCGKRFLEDCIGKFDNGINHQGFFWVPTPEDVYESPVSATYAARPLTSTPQE